MKRGKGKNSGVLPNSLKIISSCLKTVSTTATSIARSSVSAHVVDNSKDQLTWAGFDKLELGPTTFRQVLLLGYQNGFQVFDVEDASNFSELVSKRDGPVAFLQMLPLPAKLDGNEERRELHPLLLVVAGDEPSSLGSVGRDHATTGVNSPMAVRFYSLRSNCFVQMLKFRSDVCMVKCSSQIVAVGLATQIYCIDALTLQSKFSVLTFPVPQFVGKGSVGINFGYGPMAVGPRWLAYASSNPLSSNTGRLSPKNVTLSPGVSPSTSPGAGSGGLMARYAMESSKHLAAGIINLGDIGYKTISPLGPTSGQKVGRIPPSEMENAGMVVVKDFISRAVISQFRAHSSPISALCFDQSGTLLVTASVHGNNINIFRIMPSGSHNGAGNSTHDWSSAHVHLYKLHRGITTAIIRDICFSQYSQWVAVTSNKGTCHIYVLSPFGDEVGYESIISRGKDPSQYPVLSLPWWSTPFFIKNHLPSPPLPVTSFVVSRIRDGNSGLLNSVTTAASSAAGKVAAPSGAIAAVFHNSMSTDSGNVRSISDCLEHLLVYTPSGHIVQYSLMPLISSEPSDNGLRTRPISFTHTQDEDLRVRVEPFQWWDACRRSDWPEREESVSGLISTGQELFGYNYRTNILEGNKCVPKKHATKSDSVKPFERSHWYLANAEVQINSGRLPLWQRSKVRFHIMNPPRIENCESGELDVTQITTHEVELKWKDLLPVFDHFHSTQSTWSDRGMLGGAIHSSLSIGVNQVEDKVNEETVICHSNPASLSSTESSDGGSSRRNENLLDLDQMSVEKPIMTYHDTGYILNQEPRGAGNVEFSLLKEKPLAVVYLSSQLSIKSNINSSKRAIVEAPTVSGTFGIGQEPMVTIDHFDSSMNLPSNPQNTVDLEAFFHEGYCKSFEDDECGRLVEEVTEDVELNEKHGKSKVHGDDRESDDLLGGMFLFSEEG